MSSAPYEDPRASVDPPKAPAASAVPVNAPAADATLSDAWMTIRKRKWIILGFGVLGALYGTYEGATQLRLYDAYGTIEIRSGSSNEYRLSGGGGGESSNNIGTEVYILKSDSLMLSVARDLNLANNPDFTGGPHPFWNIDDPVIRQTIVGNLQNSIAITPILRTDLIRIDCSTFNPKLSASIVNTLVHDYMQHSFQTRADATKRVQNFFSTQLDELRQDVQNSQEQMLDLQRRLGALAFDPSHNQITSNLDAFAKQASSARLARLNAQINYDVLSHLDRDSLDLLPSLSSLGNDNGPGSFAAIRNQLQMDRYNLAIMDTSLGPNNPKEKALRMQIQQLQEQIHQQQDRVLEAAKQAYLAAQSEEAQSQAALDQEQANALKLRDDLLEYNTRSREFESNRTLYEGLMQRLRTAGVEAGLESTEIDIIDPAQPPLGPSLKPKNGMIIVNTSIMLVFGIILAFILDSLDTGLSTVSEVENVSGLPSLALIPRGRRIAAVGSNLSTATRNLGTLTSPKSQFAEAFRALRTSLLLSVAGGEPKIILLTSATPSEGKTTVSINLACVLAQSDVRVLLIDADLRRPTVHHRFGLNGKVGLTSVLTGSMTLEQAVQQIPELPTLDILVSGPVPPFPTEMLASESMRDLLRKARGIYTHIVMDSPPLLSVTDSVVLARDADATVMIVRHGKSSKHMVRRGRDLLVRSGAPLTGIVLNAVDLNSPEYYAYYGYYGYSGYAAAGVDSAGWETQKNGDDEENGGAK
jgi:capsular exopolysaccharide synthesis family protein